MQRIVCAGLISDKDRYVIVQESKDDIEGSWSLPAGRLESNESLEDCVSREVKEETGFDTDPIGLVGVYFHINEQDLVPIIVYEMDHKADSNENPSPERYDVKRSEWSTQRNIAGRDLRSGYVLRAIQDYERRGSVETSYVDRLNTLDPSTLTKLKMRIRAVGSDQGVFHRIGVGTAVVILLAVMKYLYLVYKKRS